MRLNKYIAQAGICSRRTADELTLKGKVKINGAVLKQPGYDVQPGDKVEVEGRLIEAEAAPKFVYYALNKPTGYITTTSDEKGRDTVLSLLTDVNERVFPVGRLDYMTSGLLLLTNDGQLTQHISHPSKHVYKTYEAWIDGPISKEKIWELRNGVMIDGRKTAPANINLLKQTKNQSLVEVQIYEGRNRQVRRMFEAVGFHVTALHRTAIGDVKLGRLLEGHYRKLTPKEVEYLKNC